MVGSYYYLWSSSDWQYTSIRSAMMQNKLRKLLTSSDEHDLQEFVPALRAYVEYLEEQLSMLKSAKVRTAQPQ